MEKKDISPLMVDGIDKITPSPKYSDEELKYLGNLKSRLQNAMDQRDETHDEFDGMTYLEWVEANKKGANTYIKPKSNKYDTNFVSGTIRQKIFAFLAAVKNLDLSPDIQTFDSDNNEIKQLGESMEDILFKVGELDNDEEKQLLRQYELMEQGTVFIEEIWETPWRKRKSKVGKLSSSIKKPFKWTTKLKKMASKCVRKIVIPENVYLGDINQFDMNKQPYIFTLELRSYEETKSIYGKWDRWKNVPKNLVQSDYNDESEKLYSPFKLLNRDTKDECEIIKYQDKWNDEYMILINGVMMNQIEYPLSSVNPTYEYNIEKQILEPISPFFAYGKSIPSRMKTTSALLDEMYIMALLKTQKSFAPPMANNTGRVLSSSVFSPGKLTTGIDPERLQKIDPDARGVDASEYKMLEMLQRNIDTNSVDPTFTGQQPKGSPTATQVLETQKQAKMMIGLTVFACSQLEKKIAWLRIDNILANWFNKVDTVYLDNDEFINKYRSVSRKKMIEGAGSGSQITRLTDKLPSSEDVMAEEDVLSTPTSPVRITYLKPDEVKKSKYMWFVSVVPKERKTDALNKVVFGEMMDKAMTFPSINLNHLGERFAEVWEENPAKLFNQEAPPEVPQPQGAGAQQTPGVPKIPSAQNAAGGINKAAM